MDHLDKKTMIVGTWAPPMPGGPHHLHRLLAGIQSSDYIVIARARTIATTPSLAEWLPCRYAFFDEPALGKEDLDRSIRQGTLPWHSTWGASRIARGFLRRIPILGALLLSAVDLVTITRQVVRLGLRMIREERIEMMMALSDEGPALYGTFILHLITRKPYALFFFDIFRGNAHGLVYDTAARLLERRLIASSALLIVTNERTREFYQKRYPESDFRTAVIYNSVFPEEFRPEKSGSNPSKPFTILYTGTVYWAQLPALQNLIRAVGELGDLQIKLDLCVLRPDPQFVKSVEGLKNVSLRTVPQSEIPETISEASLLFLPFAWHSAAPDIIATATPSKFTTYLASGVPMLVHAPPYACVSELTRRYNLGCVVDQDDPFVLAAAIRDCAARPEKGREFARNARQFFDKYFDARKNTKSLVEYLNSSPLKEAPLHRGEERSQLR